MTRQSMTYGQLPSREDFDAAFDREVQGRYRITLSRSDSRACDGFNLGDGEWRADQLWSAIRQIVDSPGDEITVSEDEEWEDVYQILYPGTDHAPVEIGPDADELIQWAQRFDRQGKSPEAVYRAVQDLNYASAYGATGRDFTRKEAAMDLVSAIMETLGFEWI